MYAIPYYCAKYDGSLMHQRIWMYHNFLIPILLCRIWWMPFVSRHLDVCHSLLYIQNMRRPSHINLFGCIVFNLIPYYIYKISAFPWVARLFTIWILLFVRLNNLKNLRTLKSIDIAYETTSSFYDKGAVRRINTGHFGAKSTFEL